MPNYMVFFGRRGHNEIVWRAEENPVGVYTGENEMEACQKASAHKGVMGAFFAIEGVFWGFTPNNTPTSFGTKVTTDEKLGKVLDTLSERLGLPPGEILDAVAEIEGGEGE